MYNLTAGWLHFDDKLYASLCAVKHAANLPQNTNSNRAKPEMFLFTLQNKEIPWKEEPI